MAAGHDVARRCGAWVSVTGQPSPAMEVEEAIRALRWPERALEWRQARWWSEQLLVGCGFDSHDAYTEFSQSRQELPKALVLRPAAPDDRALLLSCSLGGDEQPDELARRLVLLEAKERECLPLDDAWKPLHVLVPEHEQRHAMAPGQLARRRSNSGVLPLLLPDERH